MKIVKLLSVSLLSILLLSISACSLQSEELEDVTNIIPAVYKGVSNIGIGNPDMVIQIDCTFPEMPQKINVYQIEAVDEETAKDLTLTLGFEDKSLVISSNSDYFTVSNEDFILEIYLTGRIEMLSRNSDFYTTPAIFPSDEECINTAKNWLKNFELYPEVVTAIETNIASTVGTAEKGSAATEIFPTSLMVKFITSVNGYDLYISGASIRLGDQGEIINVHIFQPMLTEYGTTILKTPQEAFEMLENYIKSSSSEQTVNGQVMCSQQGVKLVINNISLQYTNNPNTLYLQPIYVFEGTMYLDESDFIGESFVGCVDAINH